MKRSKKNILLALSILCSFSVVGCNGTQIEDKGNEDDDTESKWSEEERNLMKKYCGEVLPYPSNITGTITLEEKYDNNSEQYCLVFQNEASSFTLKDYYKQLEDNRWTTITSFNRNKVQTNNNTEYVELTKYADDDSVGYEIMYYFSTSGDTSYNYLLCYNYFTCKERKETNWSESDLKAIEYVMTSTIPYIALGDKYGISSLNDNTLYIYDYYIQDLSHEYIQILAENGYILDLSKSHSLDKYYLTKTNADGSIIDVLIQYYNGNNFYFYYTPKTYEYSSWPSDVVSEATEGTDVEIPSFDIKEGGKYNYYTKHDVHYIYTYDLDTNFDYYSYAKSIRSELFSWDEKLSVHAYILQDDNGDETAFLLYFEKSTPTSTFTSSWPSKGIEEGILTSLNVRGVTVPNIDLGSLNLKKDSKYNVYTQSDYDEVYEYYLKLAAQNYGDDCTEEELKTIAKSYADSQISVGVELSFYDTKLENQTDYITRYKVNETYKQALFEAGWYKVPDSWGNVYEDPTGKIKITVSNTPYSDDGYTKVTISAGSGETHEPVFKFSKESYEIGIGSKLNLNLETNMIPYTISYSSSDTTGKITVDENGVVRSSEDSKNGDQATIKAYYVDSDNVEHSVSCTVTVVKTMNYSTTMDEVIKLLSNNGYDAYTRADLYSVGKKLIGESCTVNLGSTITKDEAKTLVYDNLVPADFKKSQWESDNDDESDEDSIDDNSFNNKGSLLYKHNLNNAINDNYLKSAFVVKDKEKLYCSYVSDSTRLTLRYYLYTNENNEIILYIESTVY